MEKLRYTTEAISNIQSKHLRIDKEKKERQGTELCQSTGHCFLLPEFDIGVHGIHQYPIGT